MARTALLPSSAYKQLSVAHLNINSLKAKLHNVYYILRCRLIHVLALSETHLDASVDNTEMNIRGYSLYRRDRDKCGGGVALYVHAHVPAQLRPDLMLPEIEILWVEAHLPQSRPLLVGCCYRPPGAAPEYLDHVCRAVELLSQEHKDIFLLGDFNIDWLSNSSLKEELAFVTTDCGLAQLVTLPTRVTVNSYGQQTLSCIDHIYTNVPRLCSKPTSTATGCSDHNVVGVTVNRKAPRAAEEIIIQRSFRGFSPRGLLSDLQAVNWDRVYETPDPESALSSFLDIFCPIADRHAPLMMYRVKNNFAPWLDEETKSLMSDRDAAKAQAEASGSMRDWNCYLELKRDVCEINRDKKKEYFQQRLKEADQDVQSVWDTLNGFMGRNGICPVATIESEGRVIRDAADVAAYLNHYYVEEMRELRSGSAASEGASSSCSLIRERIMKNQHYSFSFTAVAVDRVREALASLPDAPAGLDHLDGKLLKAAAQHISAPVCHILNTSLLGGVFPSPWKHAKVVPVPKNHNANFSGENSRAVCLLPVLSQVLEKMMVEQIHQYFVDKRLLAQGPRPLEDMMDSWHRDLDSSKLVGALFLDLGASSDLISPHLLLDKLRLYGFSEASLRLLRSYVSDRKQKVCYNGSLSDFGSVDWGLPRGSRLGPLLFSIFTNDLLLDLEQSTGVVCDRHVTLYYSACCRHELADVLEVELRAVQDWVGGNGLALKVSDSVVLGNRKTLFDSWQVVLSVLHFRLDHVNPVQLLAAWLRHHPSWALHFNNILKKMEKDICLNKLCPRVLSQGLRSSVVHALVLSFFTDRSVI